MTKGPIFRDPDGRRLRPDEVAVLLRDMVGEQLAGGCPDCAAWHTFVEDVPDVIDLLVVHDPRCPTLRPPDADEA